MVATLYAYSALLLQEASTSWDLRSMLKTMSPLALAVVFILFVLSIYSFGISNAFKGIAANKATGLSAVAGGIAEALVTTAFGLLVAVPAVWAYNYFTNKVEAFDVEMDNSSMELINYFILRRGAKK